MKIKYSKLTEKAVAPFKKYNIDAGFDLTATWIKEYDKYIEYGTDIAIEIPEGYVGLLFPRSSIRNQDLMLKNSVGVVDASYRGEIKFSFYKTKFSLENMKVWNDNVNQLISTSIDIDKYEIGERCGQIVIMKIPDIEMIEADKLSETDRGTQGYGSSGK